MPDAPKEILRGRQRLEEIAGVEVLSDVTWHPGSKLWYLELALSADVSSSGDLPVITRWCIALSPDYPRGNIDVSPSREGGITETFQHQRNNSLVGAKEQPWRPGKICVDTGTAALDRHGSDAEEPRIAAERLQWHVERLKLWLNAAARGELVQTGDPFELPDYRPVSDATILFREDPKSLASWSEGCSTIGRVTFAQVNERTLAAVVFEDDSGEPLYSPEWGHRISASKRGESGLWLLVPEVVVASPWQAPMTWGALRKWFDAHGIDLMEVLSRFADSLRNGQPHQLLIGFPIPAEVDKPPTRLHWIALQLPVLTDRGARIKGFRNHGKGLWRYDSSRLFHSDSPIIWVATENAHDSELTSRGSLDQPWSDAPVFCLGTGALGSAVAELLVRGGVRDLTLCDSDDFEAGNLVRHTLTLSDVGGNKAEALAARLNDASPNANVRAVTAVFPPTEGVDRDLVARATIVIDCSANDDVLYHLNEFPFAIPPAVFHISFGREATRLFLYGRAPGCVEPRRYLDWIDPWLESEREEFADLGEVRPSAGCWHPTFPARADHVWLLAAAAMSWMDAELRVEEFEASIVLKRTADCGLAQESPHCG